MWFYYSFSHVVSAEKETVTDQMDTLFKIVHIVSFNTSIQALMLLYHVMDSRYWKLYFYLITQYLQCDSCCKIGSARSCSKRLSLTLFIYFQWQNHRAVLYGIVQKITWPWSQDFLKANYFLEFALQEYKEGPFWQASAGMWLLFHFSQSFKLVKNLKI